MPLASQEKTMLWKGMEALLLKRVCSGNCSPLPQAPLGNPSMRPPYHAPSSGSSPYPGWGLPSCFPARLSEKAEGPLAQLPSATSACS